MKALKAIMPHSFYSDLEKKPTLSSSQSGDLKEDRFVKVDDVEYQQRIWVSRDQSAEDAIMVERRKCPDGKWFVFASYSID